MLKSVKQNLGLHVKLGHRFALYIYIYKIPISKPLMFMVA